MWQLCLLQGWEGVVWLAAVGLGTPDDLPLPSAQDVASCL